jgi:ATP-binding cassette subfamily F protein 3
LEREIKEIDVELETNYDHTVSDPNFFDAYQKKKDLLVELMSNWEEIQLDLEKLKK